MDPKKNFSKYYKQKLDCWNKAKTVEGRKPERWRYDAFGNIVLKRLEGCGGPLCFKYYFIKSESNEGKTIFESCEILQNNIKTSKKKKNLSLEEMKNDIIKEKLSEREMDLIELIIYGSTTK